MDDKGFIFFTNMTSRKGKELAANPFACATFFLQVLERQVIIDGAIEQLSRQEVETYFSSRPKGAQIGSWASHQDEILSSRQELEKAYHFYEEKFSSAPIPPPSYWGGYRIIPDRFEFWQGRQNRLSDRFRYFLDKNGWQIVRLAP